MSCRSCVRWGFHESSSCRVSAGRQNQCDRGVETVDSGGRKTEETKGKQGGGREKKDQTEENGSPGFGDKGRGGGRGRNIVERGEDGRPEE